MAKPLRSQLNQVRAWVRQGRTDAWIAHQLEVSTSELREFRRRHELSADGEDTSEEPDLRDEIEAEIEAATREDELAAESEEDDEDGDADADADDTDEDEDSDLGRWRARGRPGWRAEPRRRRRRRGGRGRGRAGAGMQASFDHGDRGGLRPLARPGDRRRSDLHRALGRQAPVEVTVEPDRIVIKRSE